MAVCLSLEILGCKGAVSAKMESWLDLVTDGIEGISEVVILMKDYISKLVGGK